MQRAVVERSDPAADERARLAAGLLKRPASIPPKYFYDALGCALYAAICETPEYYPTRTEAAIFATHASEIARRVGAGGALVDLGSGDGRKAQWWIPRLRPACYVGIDYAADALDASVARLGAAFPDVRVRGVVADFSAGLDVDAALPDGPATFFYPGSSIGNFAPDDALALLRAVHAHTRAGRPVGLLIGVDTHKDRRRLEAAYDDALGITGAFNRNVLNHVNRVLGADFDACAFRHVAFYNEPLRRIEMHLEAVRDVAVRIGDAVRPFASGERIHTENSYKYEPAAFEAMLRAAGFDAIACWTDAAGDFAVFHAR